MLQLAAEIGLHDQAEDNLPFYRRRKFKVYAFWAIWFTGFAAAGIGLAIIEHDDAYKEIFRLWPYCIFLALLPAIWFAGQLIAVLVIWMVEKFMFTVKNALFFAYAIRVSFKAPSNWRRVETQHFRSCIMTCILIFILLF